MSIKAMTYVWEHSAQRGSALLMMLAIADMANDDGDCWPGVSRLATKTRMSERNAQKTIRKLQDDGELLIFENQGTETAHGWTNRYRVVMGGVSLATPPTRKKPLRGERGDTSRGEPHDTPGVNGVTPKPSVEPKGKTKEKTTPNGVAPSEHVAASAILDAWLKHSMVIIEDGKNIYAIKAYTNKAKALHNAGITPADVIAFIAHLRTDKYHKDRGITLEHIVNNILPWKAAHRPPTPEPDTPAPVENPARPDYPYSNLTAEQHAELDALFAEAEKNL